MLPCSEHVPEKEPSIPWFVFLMLYNTAVEEMVNTSDRMELLRIPEQLREKGKYRCGATLLNRRVHVGFDN